MPVVSEAKYVLDYATACIGHSDVYSRALAHSTFVPVVHPGAGHGALPADC